MSTYLTNIPLTLVFERLDVLDATEIAIEEGNQLNKSYFVARSRSKRTYIDRRLAVRLRADGAVWRGDIRRDPCPVS